MRASRGDLHINRAGIQSDNLLNDVLWWRRRESNSRPEAINTSLYVRS